MRRLCAALFVVALALAAGVNTQAPALVHLAVAGRANSNAGVAVDGARVAVAWAARAPGGETEIYAAASVDGGRTFATPVRTSDGRGTARVNGEMAPHVAFVRRSGQAPAIDVLWTSRETNASIRIARSIDGGRTFGGARELQAAGAAGNRGWATLTTDDGGATHALWLDHRGMASGDAGEGGHHHGQSPAATRSAAAAGAQAAQGSALYYSNGASEREIVSGVCYCCKTALAAGPDGTLFAAWRHVYPGNIRDIAFTTSRDGGRTFASPARVSEDRWQLDGCPEDGPAAAVDTGGTVHLVWPTVVTQPDMHKAIFYATTADGKRFTARARVSPTRRNVAHPQIAIGADGEIAVFWDEIVAGRRRVFLSRRDGNGGFGAPEALSAAVSASYPVSAFADGAFVVAWTEGGPDDSSIVVRRLPAQ